MYKIVKVTYYDPPSAGSSRDSYPNVGRMVKAFKDNSRVMIVNPEIKTEADLNGNNDQFKWGKWVSLNEATFEEVKDENLPS
jgi:hypothetical protein